MSFILIFLIPEDIMQYDWAQSFVNFMGYVVPMVDGLENIRVNGVESPRLQRMLIREGLTILPHISFYYSLLWAYAWISLPYMLLLINKNFVYNKDSNFLTF
jgi:hypothetical protein